MKRARLAATAFAGVAALGGIGVLPLLAGGAGAQDAGPRPAVTNAVQVTGNPAVVRGHASPQIARNPSTGELVVVEAEVRGTRECSVHISADDGRSWRPGAQPLEPPFTDCSYRSDWGPFATVAFDRSGTLLLALAASDPAFYERPRDDIPRHVFLARSSDSGRSWQTTMVYKAPDGDPKNGVNKGTAVAVDPKDPRNVYVGWRQGTFSATAPEKLKTQVAASTDGGRTFGPPVEVTDARGGDFPWLTVTPDGVLHAVTWTRVFPPVPTGQPNPVRELFHVSSADKGKTFERHSIDPGNSQHERPPVVASNPATGALYVAWAAQPDAANGVPGYTADLEIYFRSSVDGGKTWSEKLTLNDDGRGRANQNEPGIAVAPNGRVDVAWYDGRHSPAPIGNRTELGFNDVYYTYSVDGGRTFAPNIRVSDRSADRSIGVWANNIDQRNNVGLASSNESAYFAWSDTRHANRDFQPEDIYSATVKLGGSAAPAAAASEDLPAAVVIGAGFAVGLGLAMSLAWWHARSLGPAPGREATPA